MPYKDPEKQKAAHRAAQRRYLARERAQKADLAQQTVDMPRLALPDLPDRDELLRLLGVQARQGHVVAIRTLLDEYRREHHNEKPQSAIAEIARHRAS